MQFESKTRAVKFLCLLVFLEVGIGSLSAQSAIVAERIYLKRAHPLNYETFCRTYPLSWRCMGAFAAGGKRSLSEPVSDESLFQTSASSSAELNEEDSQSVEEPDHFIQTRAVGAHKTLGVRPVFTEKSKTKSQKQASRPKPKTKPNNNLKNMREKILRNMILKWDRQKS